MSHTEQTALARVAEGAVTTMAGIYLDAGGPASEHLTKELDGLHWIGYLHKGEGDPLWEVREVSLTEAGQARYAELCELPGADPQIGTQTPTGRRLSGPPPGGRSGPT